jgi:hypothetical protein
MPKGTVSKVTRVTRKSAATTVAGKTAAAGPGTRASIAPSPEVVAARAYEIYLEEGRPEGRQLEHWIKAEAELLRS